MNPEICKHCQIAHDYFTPYLVRLGKDLAVMSLYFNREEGRFESAYPDCSLYTNDYQLQNIILGFDIASAELKQALASHVSRVVIPFVDLSKYSTLISVGNNCPYRLEHQLYDWNRKNECGNMSKL